MTIAEGISSAPGSVSSAGMAGADFVNQLTSTKIKVKPKGLAGIGGFVFDYEAETTLTMQAEITDHFAENGSVLNDHRVVKPMKITLRGFVGEIVYQRTAGIAGLLSLLQSKLTTVPAYLGKYTPQALGKVQGVLTQAQTISDKIDQYADRTKNIVGMFQKSAPGATKQEQAFNTLKAMFLAGTVFTVVKSPSPWAIQNQQLYGIPPSKPRSPKISVVSPWAMLDDMMLETVTFTQDETNKFETDISITLKQVRFANVQTTQIDPNSCAGRAGQQNAPAADNGNANGTAQNVSMLHNIFGAKT